MSYLRSVRGPDFMWVNLKIYDILHSLVSVDLFNRMFRSYVAMITILNFHWIYTGFILIYIIF